MPTRFRLSFSIQMFLAVTLGILLGGAFARTGASLFCVAGLQICDFTAGIFLVGAQSIALPMIVSSVILGATGLEPMRNLGRIVGKTLLWIAASSLAAALVGAGIMIFLKHWHPLEAWSSQPNSGWLETFYSGFKWHWFRRAGPPSSALWAPWLGVTLLSLGFGFYRNQIEEGHARLIVRFCQALDEMLTPLIVWARRFLPVGAVALAASWTARQGEALYRSDGNLLSSGGVLAVGLILYGWLILPGALWLFTRINSWRYLRLIAPALWVALLSGSPAAALPLTMDAVRREAGVPNRVAGPVLSLCAALGRDGLALVWVLVFGSAALFDPTEFTASTVLGWVTGCGPGAARTWSPYFSSVTMELRLDKPMEGWAWQAFIVGAAVWLLCGAAAAVSVWSHACAAAVIAYSEGERNLLSASPPKDPLAFDDLPDVV